MYLSPGSVVTAKCLPNMFCYMHTLRKEGRMPSRVVDRRTDPVDLNRVSVPHTQGTWAKGAQPHVSWNINNCIQEGIFFSAAYIIAKSCEQSKKSIKHQRLVKY